MNRKSIIICAIVLSVLALLASPAVIAETTDDNGDWSEHQVLPLVQTSPDNYDSETIDEIESWAESEGDAMDEDDRDRVEAWLVWAETGDSTPYDGLDEDRSDGQSQSVDGAQQTEVESVSANEDGYYVMGDVTITDHSFNDNNVTLTYTAEDDVSAQFQYVSVSGDDVSNMFVDTFDFSESSESETVTFPADGESTATVSVYTEDNYQVALGTSPPPLIRTLNVWLLWVSGVAGAIGVVLYVIHFYMRREEKFIDFVSSSAAIKGRANGNLAEEIERSESAEEIDDDVPDDNITAVFKRYLTVKRLLKIALVFAAMLYIVQIFTFVNLGLPTPNDYVVSGLGFLFIGYLLIGAVLVNPVLKALWRTELEYVDVLDEVGSSAERYVAKKGTFKKKYDAQGTVPVRQNEDGETVYLLSEIDRDEHTAQAAFGWQLDGYEPDQKYVETGDDLIALDQILSSPEWAEKVIVDMFSSANDGRQIRKFLPMIKQQIRYDEGKSIAIGLSRAIQGESVEGVLADMIPSYESKEEELQDKYEKKSGPNDTMDEIRELMGESSGMNTGFDSRSDNEGEDL